MTILQKQFSKYIQISLTHDAIDFCRIEKTKKKHEILLLDNINENEVSVSLSGKLDTSFFCL